MRLQIRPEQMSVIQDAAEQKFVRRLAAHLLAEYPKTAVLLPDAKSVVDELPEETLHSLIRSGIEKARKYGLRSESALAAFCLMMFEVAPNFDVHELSQPFLTDENIEPDARLDALLEQLTDKDLETIKAAYDVEAWHSKPEE